MHRSTWVLITGSLLFASGCRASCGNYAHNRALAEAAVDWRYDGTVTELQKAAVDALVFEYGIHATELCFNEENVCVVVDGEDEWVLTVHERRSGLTLDVTQEIGESQAMDVVSVVVAAIEQVDPDSALEIEEFAREEGRKARERADARCDRCRSFLAEAGEEAPE